MMISFMQQTTQIYPQYTERTLERIRENEGQPSDRLFLEFVVLFKGK